MKEYPEFAGSVDFPDSMIASGTIVRKNVRIISTEKALTLIGRMSAQSVSFRCSTCVATIYEGTRPPPNSIVKKAIKEKNPLKRK
ncbi:hypothetical protein PACILC2_48720 [Paenibacillus cisolokensis]|uniref:Uncharacterized protein n=1 Tax=Paenibacillus cisolokensis TaxID=1658519 RepID=A0ABQ4NED3_9BACL|nr:hypothetical protein PACILC2_48720 [Paenibacillus cisolokensis]